MVSQPRFRSRRGEKKRLIGKLRACNSMLENKIDDLLKCEHFDSEMTPMIIIASLLSGW